MRFLNSLLIFLISLLPYSNKVFCLSIPLPQRANITIHAELIDSLHSLIAQQTIEYINNSPDTLNEIYIHLWANAWINNQTTFSRQLIESDNYDFHFANDHEFGGYTSLEFTTNGKRLSWGKYNNHEDIAILYLDKPILPFASVWINIDYQLVFPDARFSRLGHHQGSYYATQWFPKPAVYDQNGWNPMPYLHRGEFYSSFGDYEIFITLPENYVVASSGILQNTEEKSFLDQLAKQTAILGASRPNQSSEIPSSSTKTKTLHFKQQNVHDFAWFADKQFQLLKDSVRLHNDSIVHLYAFFTHDAKQWMKANQYMADITRYMSEKLGTYPWQQVTAVQGVHSGGANMEYPAITIIDRKNSDKELERVLVHEVIHNWFYGIIANNERKEPWIDEGFTTWYEKRYFSKKYPNELLLGPFARTMLASSFNLTNIPNDRALYLYYMLKAARHLDQPAGAASEELTEMNYYAMTYFKAAMAIEILENYLGTEIFEKMMRDFYSKWKFNHPSGKDIQYFFSQYTGKDLDWFFDDLIGSNKKIDLQIQMIKDDGNGYTLLLKNVRDVALPFPVTGFYDGKVQKTIWVEGFTNQKEIFFPGKDYDRFTIDHMGIIPEIRRNNNSIRTAGLLEKKSIPEFQFLGSLHDPKNPKIYWAPIIGFNTNDGFMPGLAFYNYVFPVAQNDILLMPVYSTSRDNIAGTAWFYRDFYPNSQILHSWRGGLKFKKYALKSGSNPLDYSQLESSLRSTFNSPRSSRQINTYLQLTNFAIQRDKHVFSQGAINRKEERFYVNRLSFIHDNKQAFNHHRLEAEILQAEQMLRTSITFKALFPLKSNKKGVHMRLFAGTFFMQPDNPSGPDFRFSLQGTSPARATIYDNTFLGYNQGPGSLAGNQTTETYGGFKFPTPLGLTWNWLTAINVAYDLPILPLRVYFDTGTYQKASEEIPGTRKFPYVAGLQATFFNDAFQVNFPLIISDDIKRIAELNKLGDYYQRITFSIDFDQLSPLQVRRNIHMLLN